MGNREFPTLDLSLTSSIFQAVKSHFSRRDVNGRVSFRGWIIGTIPFGQKYGRVCEGQLSLTFEKGRIALVSGSATELVRDLSATLARSPGLREVNEFAIDLTVLSVRLPENIPLVYCGWKNHVVCTLD